MLNKVLLIGNTTRAIELRYLPSGSAVAKTGLAVNRAWKDKNTGEKKDETMFIDIVIYGKSAEIANQYLLKGKKVLVEGRLVLEQWMDQQSGQKRSKHVLSVESFQFLDSKSADTESQPEQDDYPAQQIPGISNPPTKDRQIDDIDEWDIPFKRG